MYSKRYFRNNGHSSKMPVIHSMCITHTVVKYLLYNVVKCLLYTADTTWP